MPGRVWVLVLLAAAVALPGFAATPLRVGFCELKKNPAAYDRKLIEVAGYGQRSFEDFSFFDPACPEGLSVWLEYGGTLSSGTIYCCGVTPDRKRKRPFRMQAITTRLVTDDRFLAFDRLIQLQPDSIARATLAGRFFVGPGYGHFGLFSLLAIERVMAVEDDSELDPRSGSDPAEAAKSAGYWVHEAAPRPDPLAQQRAAERGETEWAFTDPRRVAAEALAAAIQMEPTAMDGVREIGQSQGRVVYELKPRGTTRAYVVVVSRPYWRLFDARDPKRIAWVAIAFYEAGDCR